MRSLLCFVGFISVVSARLTTTPIEDGSVYKLENQEDGAFLYASGPEVTAGEYSGAPGQKWVFKLDPEGKDIYTIQPLANENNNVSVGNKYQLIKVGHGKRLFKNTNTQLCIQNFGLQRGCPAVGQYLGHPVENSMKTCQDITEKVASTACDPKITI